MKLLAYLIILTTILAWSEPGVAVSIGRAVQANSSCQNLTPPKAKYDEVFVASCAPVCQTFYKNKTAEAQKYFTTNCQAYSASENRPFSLFETSQSLTNAGQKIMSQTFAQCLPQAGKKAVVETIEFVKSLPQILDYLLSAGSNTNANASPNTSPNAKTGANRNAGTKANTANGSNELEDYWKSCEQSFECKKELARKTIQLQNASDEQIATALSKMTFRELKEQAQQDRPFIKRDCELQLGQLRQAKMHNAEEWTQDLQNQTYSELYAKAPQCRSFTTNEDHFAYCMQNTQEPAECLSFAEKLAVATACTGDDFQKQFDEMKVDFCANVVKTLVPIPLIGPQTEFFAAAKEAKIASEAAQIKTSLADVSYVEKSEVSQNITSKASEKSVQSKAEYVPVESTKTTTTAIVPASSEVRSFVDKYKENIYASEIQNKNYIQISSQAATASKIRFFEVENSAMKKLNDSTNNKDLVTSITNYQKDVFLENLQSLQKKYPQIKFNVYSDFKSVKIAIENSEKISSQLDRELQQELEKIYQVSNQQVVTKIKSLGLQVPQAGPPEQWFKAGYGQSTDQASLAARKARESTDIKLYNFDSSEVRQKASARLLEVESTRAQIENSAAFKSLLDKQNGVAIPRQDVFDLIRKNDSPEALAQAVRTRYNLKNFSSADAQQLLTYAKGVDEFSPTILIAKRELMSVDKASLGLTSADFLGLGSANAKATATAIAKKTDINQALQATRQGEKEVTASFQQKIKKFKEITGDHAQCSGDDCVVVSQKALADKDKLTLLQRLAQTPETRNIRVAFVGPGVKEQERLQLASQGESIEKNIRKQLEGKIPASSLEKVTFAFDMQTTQLNQGQVNLILGKAKGLNLSAAQKNEIQQAFARALEKYNQTGKTYTQGASSTLTNQLTLLPGSGVILLNQDQP